MSSLDLTLLHAANHFVARSADAFYQALSLSDRFSWILAACALVALWAVRAPEQPVPELRPLDSRRRVLLLFASMAASFVAARVLQHFVHRMRPLADTALEVPIDPAVWAQVKAALSLQGAFPSDHAVMFAVVTVGVFSVSRWAGAFTLLVSLYFLLLRVGVGFHWPSDVLVGALVGGGIAAGALALGRRWSRLLDPVVAAFDRYPAFAYPAAFLVVLDFSQKFSGLFSLLASSRGMSQILAH